MAQREPGDQRKTHVERFYGDEESGNEDSWVDIELIDRLVVKGFHGKIHTKTFHYFQKSTTEMAGREFTEVRIENPEDKDQFVTIKAYDEYSQRGFDINEFQPILPENVNYKTKRRHNNSRENEGRKVDIYKVTHKEIDDTYLDEDGQPPKDPRDYFDAVQATDEEDENQYVYTEVINEFTTKRGSGPRFQRTTFKLNQAGSELISLSEKSSDQGQDDAIRIDPLQNIVNVSWGGLAVEFYPKDT